MGDFSKILRNIFSINFFFTAVSNIKNGKNRQTGKQTHFLILKKVSFSHHHYLWLQFFFVHSYMD